MRARLALAVSGVGVEHREVLLRDKPPSLLRVSPKGTVPVLLLPDGRCLDQSLDIMRWALAQADPEGWLLLREDRDFSVIEENDTGFKASLDRYKYSVRFPERSKEAYRTEAEVFLARLEAHLNRSVYLSGDRPTLVDHAVFPFIRQFAFVDKPWFDTSPYPKLRGWLSGLLASPLFASIMIKHPQWVDPAEPT